MNVSFIGSGNLAWHLAPALDNIGNVVKEVFSANPTHAAALTERLYQAEVKTSLDFSSSTSRLFVIAVSDEAIVDVAREIVLPEEATLVHTSGSQPLSVMEYAATSRLGVFYPLQTFSKARPISFKDIPVFVESSNEETGDELMRIAQGLTRKAFRIDSLNRVALHVAAVFASNFANHMMTVSKSVLDRSKLDFEWLKPLIWETFNKALASGPDFSQTGPARRGDLEILDKHIAFLKEDPEVREIYRLVSQHILDTYHPD